ncbi:PREDICTED: lysine-rich arabinogalactan protein 17-like [Nicotiana attenuata]|uniref:lysine-rich arabinogalactan protein 17-like n=1 Tax=Nicotiana attenuata TaxID=49451 RepID=UPI000904B580|nr:PREDICTED: lysine-rich arabinogalactan protein 17-like [Nicotiana attenuata]
MYFRDLKVEKKPFDVKVKPVAPFSWYSLKGPDNPKDKNYKPPPSAPTGQSEEPVVVEPSIEPSTEPISTEPASTVADMPPGPSSTAGPSTSASPGIPSSRAHPITAHQLSQTLHSLNNWMSLASSKLPTLSSSIAAQSAPQPAQIPQFDQQSDDMSKFGSKGVKLAQVQKTGQTKGKKA